MNTLEAIKSRRAIKHYMPNIEIPQKDIDCLLEHMMEAPTAFNLQHWRLVQIKDTSLREKMREAAWGQEQVTEASLLFILCADLSAWETTVQQCWKDAPEDTQALMLPMIHDFYAGKEQLQRDEAIRSVGIVAQTAMLTAKALGYDSCPMMGFDQQKVAELIQLPDDHIIGMMLVVGKAMKAAHPKPGQLSVEHLFLENGFL